MSNIARMMADVLQEFKNEIKSHATLLGLKIMQWGLWEQD